MQKYLMVTLAHALAAALDSPLPFHPVVRPAAGSISPAPAGGYRAVRAVRSGTRRALLFARR